MKLHTKVCIRLSSYLLYLIHAQLNCDCVLRIIGKIPSDTGLQGVLDKVPVWHSLAISLGVPVDEVQSLRSDQSLGGILALQYWRDGKSGDLFPPTWGFLLKILKESKGPNVADALEKEVRSNPAWSST